MRRSPAPVRVKDKRPDFIARMIVVRLRPESVAASAMLSCVMDIPQKSAPGAHWCAHRGVRMGETRKLCGYRG